MTPRRPEYTRPFSAEYLATCGRPVTRLFDALKEYVDAAYVAWLEEELRKAREEIAESMEWDTEINE